MKHIVGLSLLASTTLLSCSNQSYTCVCSYKGADNTEIDSYPISASKKATAEFSCAQNSHRYSNNDPNKQVECKIK